VRRARAFGAAAALAFAACSGEVPPEARAQWEAELAPLEAEARELFGQLLRRAAADPGVAALPAGEVVIAVPTAFLDGLIQRVFADVASRVELTLSGIRVHHQKTLRKGITLGDMNVDLDVRRVHGRLAPGAPQVRFGSSRVALTLPIEVVQGSGEADVHLLWEGRPVAKAVCGDLDVRERVSGSVIPSRHRLAGSLLLEASGAEITVVPRFPETPVKLRITPSQRSWQTVDRLLESKRGLCGFVLDRVDVKRILAEKLEQKGFDVKLPLHKVKPFRFPAGLSESVAVGGREIALDVRAGALRIDAGAVWVGARVAVREAEEPPP
jgi:hypothetical protein